MYYLSRKLLDFVGWFVLLFFVLSNVKAYSQSNEEYVPFEFELETKFEFSTDIYVDPNYVPPDPSSLAFPSENDVKAGQSLNNVFDLGSLIGIKKGSEVHLVSEYKVVVKIKCNTNTGNKYILSQYLTTPIISSDNKYEFPEDVFVCQAFISEEGDPKKGYIKIKEPTPVSIITPQIIYESKEIEGVDLSNVIEIYYWITDNAVKPLTWDQKSGEYHTTIVYTMQEKL